MLLACARRYPADKIQSLASKVEVDDDPEVNYFFAGHLAFCGQNQAALWMLKTAIDRHYCSYPAIDGDPFFNQVRTNSQFQELRLAGMACHNDFTNDRDGRQFKPIQNASKQHLTGSSTGPPGE